MLLYRYLKHKFAYVLAIMLKLCLYVYMISSMIRLTLVVIFFVIAMVTTGPVVAASDKLEPGQVLTLSSQSDAENQSRRDVDFDSSVPNHMTPDSSREIYIFHQTVWYLLGALAVAAIVLVVLLVPKNKAKKQKKGTRKGK